MTAGIANPRTRINVANINDTDPEGKPPVNGTAVPDFMISK